jgi:hypothetical protein
LDIIHVSYLVIVLRKRVNFINVIFFKRGRV